MNKPRALCAAATRISKPPVVDSSKFSTWNKILLALARVFNFIYRAKKCDRTMNSTQLKTFNHQEIYLKLSQVNFFQSTIHSLQSGTKLNSNYKIRCLKIHCWMRTDYSDPVVDCSMNTQKLMNHIW